MELVTSVFFDTFDRSVLKLLVMYQLYIVWFGEGTGDQLTGNQNSCLFVFVESKVEEKALYRAPTAYTELQPESEF